jgi:hypothetical protein
MPLHHVEIKQKQIKQTQSLQSRPGLRDAISQDFCLADILGVSQGISKRPGEKSIL